MKLLWNDTWIDAPAPTPEGPGALIEVIATVPLGPVRNPSGRTIRDPYRKALRFLLTDGPSSTARKVRSKRANDELLGDYRYLAVAGRASDGHEVLALCCRVAPCAEYLLAHEQLTVPSPGQADELLPRFATSVRDALLRGPELDGQSYLYSGTSPPGSLREAVANAAAAAADPGSSRSSPTPLLPVRSNAGAERVRRLRDRGGPAGRSVAVLGAGDYARTEILPSLRRAGLQPLALADREPQIVARVAAENGFAIATTDAEAAIDALVPGGLVVVATGHDSHARLTAHALDGGHFVFSEKPAVVTAEDLDLLRGALASAPARLEVGFNRRHHRFTRRLCSELRREEGPLTVTAVVREISIGDDHWYFWPNQGTRVAGNLCHWLDLGVMLVDAEPVRVNVSPPSPLATGPAGLDGERAVSVTFADGSLVTVVATDRGDDIRGVQEWIEARRGLTTATIDDFRTLRVLRGGRSRTYRRPFREKGHRRMFEIAFRRFAGGLPSQYPATDLDRLSRIQIAATALIPDGGSHQLGPPETSDGAGVATSESSRRQKSAGV